MQGSELVRECKVLDELEKRMAAHNQATSLSVERTFGDNATAPADRQAPFQTAALARAPGDLPT